MKSKKLGIMGGTFDPVHLGHLQTAKFIYEHLGLEKIIFTYDTVMELKARYPEYELYFIIGADAVPMLNTWHRIRELLAEVTFIAADRPGYGQTIDKVCEFFGEPAKNKIILSSTGIRERVRRGLSIKGLVPESVEKYILEEHLYQS